MSTSSAVNKRIKDSDDRMARATIVCSSFESRVPVGRCKIHRGVVSYKDLQSAASRGRAFHGTGVYSNFIPGGGINLGGVRVTADILNEESRLIDVVIGRASSSSQTGGDLSSSDTAARDKRSDLNELEEGDEGVMEVGRDGKIKAGLPNSCRSSVDDRLCISPKFDLLFRILGPTGDN